MILNSDKKCRRNRQRKALLWLLSMPVLKPGNCDIFAVRVWCVGTLLAANSGGFKQHLFKSQELLSLLLALRQARSAIADQSCLQVASQKLKLHCVVLGRINLSISEFRASGVGTCGNGFNYTPSKMDASIGTPCFRNLHISWWLISHKSYLVNEPG